MTTVTIQIFATCAISFSIGILLGWNLRNPREPNTHEINMWMDRHWEIVRAEDIRRNRAALHDANRRTMPHITPGERPTRKTRIRIAESERKGRTN